MLVHLLKLQIGESYDYVIDVPTKYLVLACLSLFAVGFLFLVGAFGSSRPFAAKGTPE